VGRNGLYDPAGAGWEPQITAAVYGRREGVRMPNNNVITRLAAPPRTRRRLGRTLSRARWREYREILRIARAQEYAVLSLEAWLEDPQLGAGEPLLLLRHDVDQHPACALRMAAIEAEEGITSTWYFRWRTAHPAAVAGIRDGGHAVGLHYETLSRMVRERHLSAADAPGLIAPARELLRAELRAFAEYHGPARSACPHGDTRVPGVHNGVLLLGEDWDSYGLRWDANAAMRRHSLDVWLTDRSTAEGRWKEQLDPIDLLIDRRSPVLAVVHPNNWVSGAGLWWDRVMPGSMRTGSDSPPPLSARARASSAEPRAAQALRHTPHT
jgi:hypothetical protein